MTTTLHDLRGMVRAARKRYHRAHHAMDRNTRAELAPPRLLLAPQPADVAAVESALRELKSRETQLRAAEFDTFTRNGFRRARA